MIDNFAEWAEMRKRELSRQDATPEELIELRKIDERVTKFHEKMSFMDEVNAYTFNSYKSRCPRLSGLALDLHSGKEVLGAGTASMWVPADWKIDMEGDSDDGDNAAVDGSIGSDCKR